MRFVDACALASHLVNVAYIAVLLPALPASAPLLGVQAAARWSPGSRSASRRSCSPARCSRIALAMQRALKASAIGAYAGLELRIGVHSGPVVAGVIGTRKFAYDLWGDTVKPASRMESHGIAGRVHVSSAVEERLRGAFAFEPRGVIEVKGKGPMTTFLVRDPRG